MASDAVHDLNSLLSSKGRDFLIRNNGDQVKVSSLIGKNVGLYFSASWCPPCRLFTPKLAQVYDQLSASSKPDFEVVFVSSENNEDSFRDYFSKMPWLAIPFADSDTQNALKELFRVAGIPHLVVLDASGKVSSEKGMSLVRRYGAEAYPFTLEHIQLLKDKEEAKKNQSISSLLVSTSRNYVISNDGNRTPISELEGKLIGLYFSKHGHEFTPILVEAYKKLKEKEEKFEIVWISLDDEDEDFKESLKAMPWLALPFKDEKSQKLNQYFEVSDTPTLVIIGEDGKTSNPNAVDLIQEHGVDAYPFNPKTPNEPTEDGVCGGKDLRAAESPVCGGQDYRTAESSDVCGGKDHRTAESSDVCGGKDHRTAEAPVCGGRDFVDEKKEANMNSSCCCCSSSSGSKDDEKDEEGKEKEEVKTGKTC